MLVFLLMVLFIFTFDVIEKHPCVAQLELARLVDVLIGNQIALTSRRSLAIAPGNSRQEAF